MAGPILVIAAHPDDEVLGCGGTIARWASEGHHVHIAILGEGLTSRAASQEEVGQPELDVLARTAETVGSFLGAVDVQQFAYPDNRFDEVPLIEIVKTLETLIEDLAPALIFSQSGGDLNIDHVVTFRAAMTAARPISGCSVKGLLAYEVASSTEWAFQQFEPRFTPNFFVDISAVLDKKIKALEMYESEVRSFPHPRSPKAMEAAARRWGSTVGFEAAEAFQQIWRLE